MSVDVSFVVTIYNKKRDLPFALASLAAQEGDFSREYILVDDGSTDGSGNIAAEQIATWPDVTLIRQVNKGMNKATQVGIEAARGHFIKFLDADDVLAPFATAHLLQALKESGAYVAYGKGHTVTDFTTCSFPTPHRLNWAFKRDTFRQLLKASLWNPSMSLVLRQALVDCGGVDTRVFGCQDYSMSLRLAHGKGDFVELPYAVMASLVDLSGRESQRKDKVFRELATIAHLFFKDAPVLPWSVKAAAARRHAARFLHYSRREERLPFYHQRRCKGCLAYLLAFVAPEKALERVIALYPDYGYRPSPAVESAPG